MSAHRLVGVAARWARAPAWRACGALGARARSLASTTAALKRFPVPPMGDSISEGTVVAVSKKVGDAVGAEEVLLSVETDKVTIDVRSPEAGELTALFANVGDTVEVGVELFELALGASGAAAAPPAPAPPAPAPAAGDGGGGGGDGAASTASARAPPSPNAHSAPPAPARVRVHPSGNPVGIRFVGSRAHGPAAAGAVEPAVAAPAAPVATASSAGRAPARSAPTAPAAPAAPRGALAPLWCARDEAAIARRGRLAVGDAEARAVASGGAE
ncbi:hypothetical protein KFE25_000896 [Diacronema lutheri]|uniref:Lipoyl-binding domain-containing protein n=1 Tax=Diacronema lutheri TaxID=2081491 RepID=A0A8J5XAV8_DIALT|nr:hypothetical protein KFE25_000896 [Diacronema lutheri]